MILINMAERIYLIFVHLKNRVVGIALTLKYQINFCKFSIHIQIE